MRLLAALKGQRNAQVPTGYLLRQLAVVVLPGMLFLLLAASSWQAVTTPAVQEQFEIQPIGMESGSSSSSSSSSGTGLPSRP
jgi:uncharacterized iron-regulated membrane protein